MIFVYMSSHPFLYKYQQQKAYSRLSPEDGSLTLLK